MPLHPQTKTRKNKALVQDWNVLAEMDDVELLCRSLTERQITALAAMTEYLGWKTRFDHPPSQDTLDSFASETLNNLITEGCDMNCEELIACLQPLFDDLNSQITTLQEQISVLQYGTGGDVHELTPEELAANLAGASNPTCDLDILWSQCIAVVETTNQVLVDMFEIIEAQTNVFELAEAAMSLTGINETGAETIANWIGVVQEAVAENYTAAYTETYKNELVCALFCACQVEGCSVMVDTIYDVILGRAEETLEGLVGDWLSIAELLAELWLLNVDSVNVADFAFLMAWGTLKFGNWMTPYQTAGTRLIEVAIMLAADEPSNDWELLCEECPEVWEYHIDLTAELGAFTIATGTWVDGVGVVNNPAHSGAEYVAQINIATADWAGAELTSWVIGASSTSADGAALRGAVYVVSGTPSFQNLNDNQVGDYQIGADALIAQPDLLGLQISNSSVPGTNTIRYATLRGTGTMPTWT